MIVNDYHQKHLPYFLIAHILSVSWSSMKGVSLICHSVNPRFEIVNLLLKLLDLVSDIALGFFVGFQNKFGYDK